MASVIYFYLESVVAALSETAKQFIPSTIHDICSIVLDVGKCARGPDPEAIKLRLYCAHVTLFFLAFKSSTIFAFFPIIRHYEALEF